ncbi:hypothetical protein CSKR_108012 [Clonorchis sinensis]|uniref:Uncharacterized protein n=1 Tax=Clonorchis sinensis TaxID=79923 RepID=A0A3R7CFY6_CLOSI|nr:hypothetical protein CSKR_108012 [Clonorchis sinensis]
MANLFEIIDLLISCVNCVSLDFGCDTFGEQGTMDCDCYCSEPFINRFCPPEMETQLPATCNYTPCAWMRYPCDPADGGISMLRKSSVGTGQLETHITEKPVMEYSRTPAYHHQFHWGRCCPRQLYPGGRWSLYNDRAYTLQESQSLTHLCSSTCPREVGYPNTRPFTSCSVLENLQHEQSKRPEKSARLICSYDTDLQSSSSTEALQAQCLSNPQLTADGEFGDGKIMLKLPTANPCDQVTMYKPSPVTASGSKEYRTFFESPQCPSVKLLIKCRSRSLPVSRSSQVSERTLHPYAVTYICHPVGVKTHVKQPEECRNDPSENVGDCRARYEAFYQYTSTGKLTRPREPTNLVRFQPSDYHSTFSRTEDPSKGPAFAPKGELIHEGMTHSVERNELGGNLKGTAYTAKTRVKEQAPIRKTPHSMPATPRSNGFSHKPVDKVHSGLPVTRSHAVQAHAYSPSRQNRKGVESKLGTVPADHSVTTERPVRAKKEIQGTPVGAIPRVQSVESLKHNSVSQTAVKSGLVAQHASLSTSEESPKSMRTGTAPPSEHFSSKTSKSDATRNFSEASVVASSGRTPEMPRDATAHQPKFSHASVSLLTATPLYNWGSMVNPETKQIPGAPVPSEKILPLMSPENPFIRNALLIRLLKILRQPTTGFALRGAHQVGTFPKLGSSRT